MEPKPRRESRFRFPNLPRWDFSLAERRLRYVGLKHDLQPHPSLTYTLFQNHNIGYHGAIFPTNSLVKNNVLI